MKRWPILVGPYGTPLVCEQPSCGPWPPPGARENGHAPEPPAVWIVSVRVLWHCVGWQRQALACRWLMSMHRYHRQAPLLSACRCHLAIIASLHSGRARTLALQEAHGSSPSCNHVCGAGDAADGDLLNGARKYPIGPQAGVSYFGSVRLTAAIGIRYTAWLRPKFLGLLWRGMDGSVKHSLAMAQIDRERSHRQGPSALTLPPVSIARAGRDSRRRGDETHRLNGTCG